MQSASYQPESDLIISSIKAEICLKINAIASYCLPCTLDDWAAKSDKEESAASDALDETLNLCLYGFSHFLRLPPLLNTPLGSPQLQRLKQTL